MKNGLVKNEVSSPTQWIEWGAQLPLLTQFEGALPNHLEYAW